MVRILKDLDADISGRHVLVVEDIVDSGLTLSWLVGNLQSRGPASVRVCVLLRKPTAARMEVDVAYTGFDIDDEFVDRLRPGLRRAVPQPAVHRHAGPAGLRRRPEQRPAQQGPAAEPEREHVGR